jgi:hypothetical protein
MPVLLLLLLLSLLAPMAKLVAAIPPPMRAASAPIARSHPDGEVDGRHPSSDASGVRADCPQSSRWRS